jgi:SAM-dependent methyltransferase
MVLRANQVWDADHVRGSDILASFASQHSPKGDQLLKSALVRVLGFPVTLIHGDTLVLDRWLWLKKYLLPVPGGSKSLIDVGCGTGAFTIGAARRGYRSLGLSWDERNQRVAGERAVMCHTDLARFEVQDVRRLGERDDLKGKFDVAICLECIEHILDDQKLMSAISGCLKPGGMLLLTTPNVSSRPLTFDDFAISTVEDGGHVRKGYAPGDLQRLSAAAGLEVERVEYCSGVLSQKLTGGTRLLQRRIPYLIVWALLLPLRWIPLVFDKLATGLTRWPGYSITLIARKKDEAAGAVRDGSAFRSSASR